MTGKFWGQAAVGVVSAAAAGLFSLFIANQNNNPEPPASEPPPAAVWTRPAATTNLPPAITLPAVTGPQVYCYLGAHEGRLAVYGPDFTVLWEVFDIYLAAFPETERQRLNDGVAVPDEPALAALLEDYTS